MSKAKISIILPIYNSENYLKRCLDSILWQDFKDFEVICINDGSTDNSSMIVEEYVKRDKRFILINQENEGVAQARNKAISLIKGSYTYFLDSDDALSRYALSSFYKIARENMLDIVVCKAHVNSFLDLPQEQDLDYYICQKGLADIVGISNVQSVLWNKLIKSELIKQQRFINHHSNTDWPFITVLFDNVQKFAVIKKPLYYYNQENISITRSPFSYKKLISYIAGIEYVYNFYQYKDNLKYAKKRILTAIKMCVNKVYREEEIQRKALTPLLFRELKSLSRNNIFSWYKLPIKTILRLWILNRGK